MAKTTKNPTVLSELEYPVPAGANQNIAHVSERTARRVQEWLTLHGYGTAMDGVPGPATRTALIKFGARAGGNVAGLLDEATWNLLVAPLWRASILPAAKDRTLREVVKGLAGQHLAQGSQGLGCVRGLGPWVRSYTRSAPASDAYWGAGFVSTLIEQAVEAMNASEEMGKRVQALPLPFSLDADDLREEARGRGRLTEAAGQARPGDVFLRVEGGSVVATGIVTTIGEECFSTIEAYGGEVCARYREHSALRADARMEFIRLF